jgi:Phosphotransferase enzyme family
MPWGPDPTATGSRSGPGRHIDCPAVAATTVRRPPSFPVDRDLPGAADLLAGAGAQRVAQFLDGQGLEPHRVEPAQAHYRPGRWLAVCFRSSAVERSSGRPRCPTVTVECRAGEPDLMWAFPDDPALPGLAMATDGAHVRRRLRPRPAEVVVEPLRYRPRRRAVLRYRFDGNRVLFGKVVTPRRGRRLLALADALRSTGLRLALPVGHTGPGALVLPALSGTPLREVLLAGGPLPPPDHVAALSVELHQRCSSLLASDGLPGSTRRMVDPGTALCAAQMVARLLPGEGCAAGRLAEAVIGWAEGSEPPEEWIVHGDLYENQVFVDGQTLGLVDLDDLGPGDPLLDAANFSAHLRVLAASGPPAAAVIQGYRDELRAALLRRLDADPAALAWREAYCLLRLATGPFRVLHADWPRRMADRLALATEALSVRR